MRLFLTVFIIIAEGAFLLALDQWPRPAPPAPAPARLATGADPAPAPPPEAAAGPRLIRHRVRSGETLDEISRHFSLGESGVARLLELNGLTDPEKVPAGLIIFVPLPAEAGRAGA